MKSFDRAKRVLQNPSLLGRGVNRLYHRRGGLRSENTSGVDVFSEDWDTLVVLDACRYDMFADGNHISGDLSSRVSRGSATTEWLKANFDGRDLRDTVYVTANPQLERHRSEWDLHLHEIINVWLEEGWDDSTGTVLAETMTAAAVDAYECFPNKRLVVHYMQPHYPFVPAETDVDSDHLSSIDGDGTEPSDVNVWNRRFAGRASVTREQLWTMYTDNLEYVLDHVEDLLETIPGKSVVSSDHGNMVGERAWPVPIQEWGHPRGIYNDQLVTVPWLVCEGGDRRVIEKGETTERTNETRASENIVSDRLEDLGYV